MCLVFMAKTSVWCALAVSNPLRHSARTAILVGPTARRTNSARPFPHGARPNGVGVHTVPARRHPAVCAHGASQVDKTRSNNIIIKI